jgi:hypothetical protein
MALKLRLAGVQVLVDAYVDDGENLWPLSHYGLEVAPSALRPPTGPGFAAGPFAEAMADLEDKLNAPPEEPSPADAPQSEA